VTYLGYLIDYVSKGEYDFVHYCGVCNILLRNIITIHLWLGPEYKGEIKHWLMMMFVVGNI
jgi:hypothetical protein